MEVHQIVKELDQEIAQLKEARALLAGDGAAPRRRGRPAKSAAPAAPSAPAAKKRTVRLSAAGRRRISEALKRRWAAHRKATEKAEKPAKAVKPA